jgi:hypothetical protein
VNINRRDFLIITGMAVIGWAGAMALSVLALVR